MHRAWVLCRFWQDFCSPQKTFQREAPGGNWAGSKMACFGWNRHPSFHGRLSAWKPLLAYRIHPPLPQRCLFMCRARWSDLEKHLQGQIRNEGVRFGLLDCASDQIPHFPEQLLWVLANTLRHGKPQGRRIQIQEVIEKQLEVPEVPRQGLNGSHLSAFEFEKFKFKMGWSPFWKPSPRLFFFLLETWHTASEERQSMCQRFLKKPRT